MSAMSAVGAGGVRRRRGPGTAPAVRGFVLATVALDLLIIVFGAVFWNEGFHEAGWGLIAWIAVVAAVGAASLPFDSGQALALDMPVLLSVGYLFGPSLPVQRRSWRTSILESSVARFRWAKDCSTALRSH
jgi:hypothetical protein